MNITTALSCGDKAWTFDGERICQRTVGQVHVEYTQSPGIGDAFMEGSVLSYSGSDPEPENYKPMEPKLVERYMCVETGIGSGSVYTLGESIFLSEEECRAANAERLAELARIKKQRQDYEREQRIQRLQYLRSEIKMLKARQA
jgi:hypothetical protein